MAWHGMKQEGLATVTVDVHEQFNFPIGLSVRRANVEPDSSANKPFLCQFHCVRRIGVRAG